jgi:hypothetical protein
MGGTDTITLPFAGITRIRFKGCDLSPKILGTPDCDLFIRRFGMQLLFLMVGFCAKKMLFFPIAIRL